MQLVAVQLCSLSLVIAMAVDLMWGVLIPLWWDENGISRRQQQRYDNSSSRSSSFGKS